MPPTFNGFTNGKNKTTSYTIVSCTGKIMALKTSDGKRLKSEKRKT